MNKIGLFILGGSIAAAVLLIVIWFIGFIAHVGGALIHLALVLALIVGFVGGIAGGLVLLVGKKA